jgi:hypothetical protein
VHGGAEDPLLEERVLDEEMTEPLIKAGHRELTPIPAKEGLTAPALHQ